MRKPIICAVSAMIVALVLASGCGANDRTTVSLGQPVSVPVPSMENSVEQPLAFELNSQEPNTTSAASAPNPVSNEPDIGLEKAKVTAFEHANVNVSEAVLVKAGKDMEDSVVVYELEFFVGNTEYEYEIDALTGQIRSHSKDIDNFEVDD